MKIKNICCIGAGYVGGPSMTVFSEKCPEINFHIVDIDNDKINKWNSKNHKDFPVFEPGLSDLVLKNRDKNLFFSNEIEKKIKLSEIIFISVNTPTKIYGKGKGQSADLKYVESCARTIAKFSNSDKIIVEKSTIPVRTAETIKYILENSNSKYNFEVLSNPEFLAEGTAIEDLLNPDRVLIGGYQTKTGHSAINVLSSIYENWVPKNKILHTNVWSSELSKLVSNAFLAQRVSSINSISALCEKTDADVQEVSNAIGYDNRIGSKFLNASVGFGGSCFQKDILNLIYISRSYGLNEVADYWSQVIKINNYQKKRFSDIIISKLNNTISEKKITIFGWSFKKNTNDTRESAAIYVADYLIEERANIFVYDPQVSEKKIISDINNLNSRDKKTNTKHINVVKDPETAVRDSHAIVILTEWDEFKSYDWEKFYKIMLKPSHIFDGRILLDSTSLKEIGFKVYQIGKN